jgi:serine/threonine protein kinase
VPTEIACKRGGGAVQMRVARQASGAHARVHAKHNGVAVQMRVARQAIGALAAVHAKRVVHCDVCPTHVHYYGSAEPNSARIVKIGGFSSAQPLPAGSTGVPASALARVPPPAQPYSAPERWASEGVVTDRADVFSYGVMMYHCLMGHLPHTMNQGRIEAKLAMGKRLGVSDRVFRVLSDCMVRAPERRPSASAVAKALAAIEADANVLARGRQILVRLCFLSLVRLTAAHPAGGKISASVLR